MSQIQTIRYTQDANVHRYVWGLVAALTFTVTFAHAQSSQHVSTTTPGATIPSVIAPRLVEQTPVPYPEVAEGDAAVIVVVTVNADGSVREAHATESRAPFDVVAEGSVKRWRFEPATRDGKAIAAKIRVEVLFHAPVLRDVDEEVPPTSAPTTSPTSKSGNAVLAVKKPTEPEFIEVTVLGEKHPPMVVSLARTEVRQIPGTFGDPFRALEILPGVTPVISGLPYFYVRGAPPGNVGYYLDGIRVPYLYHVAIGPSVIQPGMVDRVDLYSGGYPARFGRYSGGIAAAETTAPNPTLHGEGNIRLYDAGALVETGFNGGRGTVLLGGRYSYTAALISLMAKGVILDYRDYQARVTYDVTPHDQVSLVAFGAYDLLAQDQSGVSVIGFGSEFYRGEMRWDHLLNHAGKVRTALTLGYDQTAIGNQRKAQDRMVVVRSELDQPIGTKVRLHAGVDSTVDNYRVTQPVYDDPDNPMSARFQELFPSRRDLALGTHGDVALELRKGFIVTPGVRVDYYVSGGSTVVGVDPRLSTRLRITDRFALVNAYGIAHQPPSFVLPIPGLALGTLANGLQTAYQTSAGIEWTIASNTTLTSNVFNNIYTKLTDALSVPERPGSTMVERTKGRAYGLEAFLHRKLTRNFGGVLSYTLSRSTRTLDGQHFPAAFDRRHVLNVAVAYNLGRKWRAGTRLVFYTGAPLRDSTTTNSPSTETPTTTTLSRINSNPPRDPAFYRIDLRLEKLWQFGATRQISFVAEVLNATMNKEVYNGSEIGPIFVPSIGVEGAF